MANSLFILQKYMVRPYHVTVMQLVVLALLSGVVCLPVSQVFVATASAQDSTLDNNSRPALAQLSPNRRQEIIEKNVRIRKLQEGIIDHKIKILGAKRKERTLIGELETIEKDLKEQKELLAELREKSEQQEVLLADKQEYLNQVLAEKKAHQVHVKNRLASYYRMGTVGIMNVLFSSETLPELLDFQEYFGIMVQYDHGIIQKYLNQLLESNRAREVHAREKLRLMKMAENLSVKEQELSQIRQEKNFLLKKVNTEQHLYEQAVKEIEEAASDLANTLQKLQVASKPKPVKKEKPQTVIETEKKKKPQAPPEIPEGFAGQKGLLEPPVKGTVFALFGKKVKGKFESSTMSNGIDIRVKKGEEIKALYNGRIIHSGYLRGYGNLIIIDHGQQYFSLIARAADYYKEEGSKVSTGEIIGLTGEGDPLYGEGLHFEIRQGSKPEDPLIWLKEDSLLLDTNLSR
jgi:septal ring factor EnvC (AmiA/AmiB activator)